MTIEEIDEYLKCESAPHTYTHIRNDFVDINSKSLLEAWEQVKTAIMLVESGISDAKSHKAEALVLAFMSQAIFHGYTPKAKENKAVRI